MRDKWRKRIEAAYTKEELSPEGGGSRVADRLGVDLKRAWISWQRRSMQTSMRRSVGLGGGLILVPQSDGSSFPTTSISLSRLSIAT